jgi:hypothetical protein
MSTDFILSRKVSARDLFGERLATFGIREHVASETDERSRRLTDGPQLSLDLSDRRRVRWQSLAVRSQRTRQDHRRDLRSV